MTAQSQLEAYLGEFRQRLKALEQLLDGGGEPPRP